MEVDQAGGGVHHLISGITRGVQGNGIAARRIRCATGRNAKWRTVLLADGDGGAGRRRGTGNGGRGGANQYGL